MVIDDLGAATETRNVEDFSIYEKSDVVKHVANQVDEALGKMETPFILLRGGPGVGKSTASYESLDYLRSRGYGSVEMQPEQFITERGRERIKDLGPNQVLFVDSLDMVLESGDTSHGVALTIDLLRDLQAKGLAPILLANIHDPYLVEKRFENLHAEKRDSLLGNNGLFNKPEEIIEVKDECADEASFNTAVSKLANGTGVDRSWIPSLQSELKAQGVNKHSIISNLLSEAKLKIREEKLPAELRGPHSREPESQIANWLAKRVKQEEDDNVVFKRAFFEPEHPQEIHKGLVRHDVVSLS